MAPEMNIFLGPQISEMVLILGPETDIFWLFLDHFFKDSSFFCFGLETPTKDIVLLYLIGAGLIHIQSNIYLF